MGSRVRNGPPLNKSWTIEKLVPGGSGFCRLPDGRSAFVDGAFPGDRVRVQAVAEKRGYVRATRFELEEAGPERVEPACSVADACGGCDWMRLSLSAQRASKVRLVVEALERTGGIRLPAPPELVTAGPALAYRSRVRLHIDDQGRVGFYGRQSHRVVPVRKCPVAAPELDRVIPVLAELDAPRTRLLARFESVELRSGADEVEIALTPRADTDARAPALAPLYQALASHGQVRDARGAFSQVNREVNAVLVARVVAEAAERAAETFLDLYAGAGNFGLPLARAGRAGVAVELSRKAARAAEAVARAEGLPLEVRVSDVPSALRALSTEQRGFDFVVLDPPRAGAKDALAPLSALRPSAVAYVSCDPVTLARDLATLVGDGLRLERVTCFDMFPQTHHVETLAVLGRAL